MSVLYVDLILVVTIVCLFLLVVVRWKIIIGLVKDFKGSKDGTLFQKTLEAPFRASTYVKRETVFICIALAFGLFAFTSIGYEKAWFYFGMSFFSAMCVYPNYVYTQLTEEQFRRVLKRFQGIDMKLVRLSICAVLFSFLGAGLFNGVALQPIHIDLKWFALTAAISGILNAMNMKMRIDTALQGKDYRIIFPIVAVSSILSCLIAVILAIEYFLYR